MINVWVISIRLGLDQIQLDAIKRPHTHMHTGWKFMGRPSILTLAFMNVREMCVMCADASVMQPRLKLLNVSHLTSAWSCITSI